MSSWLSLFKPDGYDDQTRPNSPSPSSSSGAGVIKDALSHHLRGVAAFLAPPPRTTTTTRAAATTTATTTTTIDFPSQTISGIKNDLAEIEESFKFGLSLLSTKLTSSFMQFTNNYNNDNENSNNNNNSDDDEDDDNTEDYDSGEEEGYDDEDVAGIDEEVVDFVRELSSRPEFWTDFPIYLPIEFDMSDYQREHAATIEHLVPSLVTLRQKVGTHLSDGQFWMIYFTILLPRLNEYDLKHLSTPKIVEVRETLLQKLQSERNTVVETSDSSQVVISSEKDADFDSKQGDESSSQQNISAETLGDFQEVKTVDNQQRDQWLERDPNPSTSSDAQTESQNEDDVSFSDLEDDETDDLSGFRHRKGHTTASLGENCEWTQLIESSGAQASRGKATQSGSRDKDSEGEESNDWHHVDDIDLESLASV